MSRKWEYHKNNGYADIEYNFGDDNELNSRLSDIINEACHVFYCHTEGKWKSEDKDAYSNLLANEIINNPFLVKKLLGTEDRVIKMLTYRAIELNKENDKPEED